MVLTDLERSELTKYLNMYDFRKHINNKTFLITGSKGIMGTGIIKWILFENEIHGTNTTLIASTRNPESIPVYIEKADNIEFCPFGKEEEYCKERKIDFVVHAAAPTNNRVLKAEPVESLKVIIDGTESMLKLAKDHDAEMIYFSSSEAYGTPAIDEPISETYVGAVDSLSTRSCYTLGKKTAELMCRSYYEEYGVKVRIIRPTVILGLWQQYESVKVECELLRCIMENKDFIMKTDGSTKKSVIYSLDAVAAAMIVLFKGEAGEAYNATNPATYCSVKERAKSVISEFNPKIKTVFAKSDTSEKEGYLPKYMLLEDITKIQHLGWLPNADISYIFGIDIRRFGKEKYH